MRRSRLTCPPETSILLPAMKTKLTQDQIERLNALIEETIIPALMEDICFPDMTDTDEDKDIYDEVYEERSTTLFVESINYLKNNLN